MDDWPLVMMFALTTFALGTLIGSYHEEDKWRTRLVAEGKAEYYRSEDQTKWRLKQ